MILIFYSSSGSLFESIRIQRLEDVTTPTSELFVVSCCAPDSGNLSDSVVITSYLTPSQPIDWALATGNEPTQIL